MRKYFKLQQALITAGMLLVLNSCMKEHNLYQNPEVKPKNAFFDYSLTQKVAIDIDYCFKDYLIIFEIYDQNPWQEQQDGTIVKNDIEPVFRAATDKNGQFKGDITIPATITEVWLASNYFGTISPVKLEVSDGTLTFNKDKFIASISAGLNTRALTSNGHNYPDNYLILGNWDGLGKPDYLLSELANPPAAILYDISKTYFKSGDYTILKNHPEFFDNKMTSDVTLLKPTKISLVFLNSSAGWNNAVGYYCYPTGQKPTKESDIKKIIAFPNASPLYMNGKIKGSLLCGHQVQLKYWDGQKFNDEFPAGITIGWFLQGMGFNNGDIVNGRGCRYSTQNLNENNVQRSVSLRDPQSNQIVAIGFEDNDDYDYCDATFYLNIETKDAIDDSTLPSIPDNGGPTINENYTTYFGTLTFEDQWPERGDYDMNDVMIDYNCKVYKNIIGNKVSKIVDEFTPRHNGGKYSNGFGYQFHGITTASIRKVTIQGPVTSAFMNGESMEAGQDHPTFILFDDINNALKKTFTITTELNDVEISMVTPPYNPFIIAKTDEGRGREIHLVNYPPTTKANTLLFGTGSDLSRPGDQLYYVSEDMMPFAINIPQIKDFPTLTESVKINEAFPNFTAWAQSFGTKYKDWYKKK